MTHVQINGKIHNFKDAKTARRWVRKNGLSVKDAQKQGDTYYFGMGVQFTPKTRANLVDTSTRDDTNKSLPTTSISLSNPNVKITTVAPPAPSASRTGVLKKNNPISFARDLTDLILTDHGLEHIRVVNSTRKRSCIKSYRGTNKVVGIYIGTQSVQRAFNHGFAEYESVKWVWHINNVDWTKEGLAGVFCLTLHELAHVIHIAKHYGKGKMHGEEYQDILSALIVEYRDIWAELSDNNR